MSDAEHPLADPLRGTTAKMAAVCSAPMELWDSHSNLCLQAAATLTRQLRTIHSQEAGLRQSGQRLEEAHQEIRRLRALLRRYRHETPLGHQPHMIAHEADAALAEGGKDAG